MSETKITRNSEEVNNKINEIIAIMWWCEENNIPFMHVAQVAQASFTLASGINHWMCGDVSAKSNMPIGAAN